MGTKFLPHFGGLFRLGAGGEGELAGRAHHELQAGVNTDNRWALSPEPPIPGLTMRRMARVGAGAGDQEGLGIEEGTGQIWSPNSAWHDVL